MLPLFLTLLLAAVNLGALRQPADWPVLEQPLYMSSDRPLAVRLFKATPSAPAKKDILSLGPRLAAQSALVVDADSGAILFDKNSKAVRPLASLSKLMAALVFLESKPDLNQVVVMTSEDDREGGRTYIKPAESATLANYLKASLLGSANNATIVLSRSAGTGSEEFVKTMNQKSKDLGMNDTFFSEPTGLSSGNVGSSRDIARLLQAVSADITLRRLSATRLGVINLADGPARSILNTDYLLGSIVNIVLGKTGYLDEALYNFAGIAKLKNNREVYVVVLGAQSSEERFQDTKNLIVWTQGTYEWQAK